jgi:hypothetical protein
MRSSLGSAGQHSTSPRSSIARERAEILDLINKLAADRARARRLGRNGSASASKPPPPAAASHWPGASERPRAAAQGAAFENLENRLRRVEEALLTKAQRSIPAPPGDAGAVFSGLIRGQMLSDMLQLVSSNNMTGEFVVQCDSSKCSLWFDDGRICHAVGPGLAGEQAFFAAFALESGRYYFIETTELPAERTIEAGTQFLILEALRQVDENKSE